MPHAQRGGKPARHGVPPERQDSHAVSRPVPSRRTTIVARIAAALLVALIAYLTLTPQPIGPNPGFGHWCVVCGAGGTADTIANVLMFMPLGAALVFGGVGASRATAACALYSLLIEITQAGAIPGRFATLGDVVANTIGGAIGVLLAVKWAAFAFPRPVVARRLAAATGLLWTAMLALGAWGASLDPARALPAPPARASGRTSAPGYGWFAGTPSSATIDGEPIVHRGTGPIVVQGPVTDTTRATVSASGRDLRSELVPILYVHPPGDSTSSLILAEEGFDAVGALRMNASRARLHALRVTLPGAFTSADASPYALGATLARDSVVLTKRDANGEHRAVLLLAPSRAWTLITPLPRADGSLAPLVTLLWVAALAFPLGYWSGRSGDSRAGSLTAAGVALATLAITLAAIPAIGGYRPERPATWLASVAGLLAGFVASTALGRSQGATIFTRPSASS